MSGAGGFLDRWSKRKAEARQEEIAQDLAAERATETGEAGTEAGRPPAEHPAGAADAVPPVDLSLLPSLDTITAATDISGFLKAGVPDALRNAALRKMWTSDPAIRDYVGLSEMSWDFNAPDAITGFGEIAPVTDVAEIVRMIMDGPKAPEQADPADPEAVAVAEVPDPGAPADAVQIAGACGERDDSPPPPEPLADPVPLPARRRHGGATPR